MGSNVKEAIKPDQLTTSRDQLIATSPITSKFAYEAIMRGRLQVNKTTELTSNEGVPTMRCVATAGRETGPSLHVSIGKHWEDRDSIRLYLNWKNAVSSPEAATISIASTGKDNLPSEEEPVDNELNLRKVEEIALELVTADSLMSSPVLSTKEKKQELEGFLNSGGLLKPEIVLFDCGSAKGLSLEKAFAELNLSEKDPSSGSLILRWSQLVNLASSGKLVKAWRESIIEQKPVNKTEESRAILGELEKPTLDKSKFCEVVCGRNLDELRELVEADITEKGQSITYESFMNSHIKVDLLGLTPRELYLAFEAFRRYEQKIHPRKNPNNSRYGEHYGQTYREIENAYSYGQQNPNLLKSAVIELVDKVVHDC